MSVLAEALNRDLQGLRNFVERAGALQTELDAKGVGRPVEDKPKTRRGTSNGNSNGNSTDRRRRREWLVETYRADTKARWRFEVLIPCESDHPDAQDVCRCYRCGTLLTADVVTVDRIIPGCRGGTYHRNNIRPACSDCNEKTGGATRGKPAKRACPTCGGATKYRRLVPVNPLDTRRCTDHRHPK